MSTWALLGGRPPPAINALAIDEVWCRDGYRCGVPCQRATRLGSSRSSASAGVPQDGESRGFLLLIHLKRGGRRIRVPAPEKNSLVRSYEKCLYIKESIFFSKADHISCNIFYTNTVWLIYYNGSSQGPLDRHSMLTALKRFVARKIKTQENTPQNSRVMTIRNRHFHYLDSPHHPTPMVKLWCRQKCFQQR